MTEYLTEQEQIQQLKAWIKQYGVSVLAGVAIAILIASGWHYWHGYRNRILAHASMVYDEMLTLRAQNNSEGATVQANKLLTHYANTPYGQMAAFMLAHEAVLKRNYAEAETQLKWVMKHSDEHAMQEIARIRLARIFITDKKPADALDLLKKIDDKSFIGLVDEVRGDAYQTQANFDAAREAYRLALTEIPDAEITRPILQMKYDNLAIASK